MFVRTSRSCPLLMAAVITCGCGGGGQYNEPADPAKDAAEIGAGTTPPRKVTAGRRKVTKPPGPSMKDAKGVQAVQ